MVGLAICILQTLSPAVEVRFVLTQLGTLNDVVLTASAHLGPPLAQRMVF